MNIFKEFLQTLCMLTLENIYLKLNSDNNILPHLSTFIMRLSNIKLKDEFYHILYGDLKNVVFGFLTYFETTIDDMVKEVDKSLNSLSREELLLYVEKSLEINYNQQIFFGKNFLPSRTTSDKETYEEINGKFERASLKLTKLKTEIEKFDKQSSIDEFVKQHFTMSFKNASKLCDFTQSFLAKMVENRAQEIRVSLEEILHRIKNNLRKIRKESEDAKHGLLHELYDMNKQYLQITRQLRKNSIEASEVSYTIQTLRDKIEESRNTTAIERVEEELNYWQGRLEEFNHIYEQLLKLKTEEENVRKQEVVYNQLRTTELSGSKKQCWLTMGDSFKKRCDFLNEKTEEVSRSLLTFFAVRGPSQILYEDNLGKFFVDSYNHKVYSCDYGMNMYHRKCDGEFVEFSDKDKYYFDKNGRYIQGEDGTKLYQCAPCTSTYKLGDCELLEKSKGSRNYVLEGPGDLSTQMMPSTEMKDIKGTLDSETVKYLWECFGHILPKALKDIGQAQPKNPIQYLAHKILQYKYSSTVSQQLNLKKEAKEYRFNVLRAREEKAIAASVDWRAKQVKRRKPEESDDAEQRTAADAHLAAQAHIASLNYFYD